MVPLLLQGMGIVWWRLKGDMMSMRKVKQCPKSHKRVELTAMSHGVGTHSIEGKKWQENVEHIAQDIWGCSAFMLSKWDSYCKVDFGSPSQNFFRAPPARSAGKSMEHSYRWGCVLGPHLAAKPS